jgi:UDP-N-acetylglucosamine acyltransferase
VIHPSAIIDPGAVIAQDVQIGPWTMIGPDVEIGAGTTIGPHVVIKGPTKIGCHNQIFQFASIGEDSQDKKYAGEKTFLEIGDNNVIREYCSINRGTQQGGGITRIGNNNFFMACTHVAHDCVIGNHVIFANHAAAAGHVTIGDYVILSGFSGVHQFCTIGSHSFIGAGCIVTKDVLPYILVDGHDARARALYTEGLKIRGFSMVTINSLRRDYKIIYRNSLTVAQAVEQLTELAFDCQEVNLMIEILQSSQRGIVR